MPQSFPVPNSRSYIEMSSGVEISRISLISACIDQQASQVRPKYIQVCTILSTPGNNGISGKSLGGSNDRNAIITRYTRLSVILSHCGIEKSIDIIYFIEIL